MLREPGCQVYFDKSNRHLSCLSWYQEKKSLAARLFNAPLKAQLLSRHCSHEKEQEKKNIVVTFIFFFSDRSDPTRGEIEQG